MIFLREWSARFAGTRRRAMKPWTERRKLVLETVLQLVPPGTPYWYDAALSFLQVGELNLAAPARVDLFFHDPETFHLAVDVLGPDSRPNFRDAAPFTSRQQWETRRAQIELRTWMLAQFHCPYLVITDDESVDPVSLTSRLRILVPTQEIKLP